jgi:hypothetical protein
MLDCDSLDAIVRKEWETQGADSLPLPGVSAIKAATLNSLATRTAYLNQSIMDYEIGSDLASLEEEYIRERYGATKAVSMLHTRNKFLMGQLTIVSNDDLVETYEELHLIEKQFQEAKRDYFVKNST